MLPELPFTTVWVEFHTVELAQTYFLGTHYQCRLSPECDRSVDIVYEGSFVPVLNLMYVPGVAKKPQMFVLDVADGIPFLQKEERRLPDELPLAA
jgi:hypothetical protein